jgi:hypothetical protein
LCVNQISAVHKTWEFTQALAAPVLHIQYAVTVMFAEIGHEKKRKKKKNKKKKKRKE